LQKTNTKYNEDSADVSDHSDSMFYLQEFEKELAAAQQITEHIVIGGDWNAHHPACFDQNCDSIGEEVLEFIAANDLTF
jgi:hypothetical protein